MCETSKRLGNKAARMWWTLIFLLADATPRWTPPFGEYRDEDDPLWYSVGSRSPQERRTWEAWGESAQTRRDQ